jgi:3-deoxy-7-phosphoheptulonate synthase
MGSPRLEIPEFMKACGINPNNKALHGTDFYVSHESLLLRYEEAMTRVDSTTGDYYDTSGHMLWIGDRTRILGEAHVEFFRGIKNPLGLKVGPTTDLDELVKIIDVLNPEDEAGRITLITRMGANIIEESFRQLLNASKKKAEQLFGRLTRCMAIRLQQRPALKPVHLMMCLLKFVVSSVFIVQWEHMRAAFILK